MAWILFWTFWLILGYKTKTPKRAESQLSRLTHLLLVLFAFALISIDKLRFGFLHFEFLTQTSITNPTAVSITFIGLSFAIWGRFYLGKNWSGKITIKNDHKLVTSGPYSIVRHPIYSGVLFGIIRTSIAVNEVGGILSIILIFVAYYRKISIEEKMLVENFGDEYVSYKKNVKSIIPFII